MKEKTKQHEHCTEEKIQLSSKYMTRYSTSLVIWGEKLRP